MSDVMSVRLHLSGVRVMEVGVDSVDRLKVEVESARRWSRCRHCGFCCYRVWGPASQADSGPWGERPAHNVGVASPPVRVFELWGAPS